MELPVLMVDPDKLQVFKQKNYWRISSLALTKIGKIVAHYQHRSRNVILIDPKNPGLSWDILRMGLEPLIPL